MEKHFIAVYRQFYGRKECYNQADGGQGGNLGEEANKKRSYTMKGKYVGEKNPMYGKHHTEETKKKQSDAQNGEKNHNWGKHHTEETKAKQSAAMKGKGSKQILQYDLQGNFIREWESISQAANELSLSIGNINSVCNGKRKRVGNFIFKYYKKEETI